MSALVVDADHLGTPEQRWMAPGVLDAVPGWDRPAPRAVVVAAPHPDDEVLGPGGVLATWAAAGTATHLVAVTDGEGSHPGATDVLPPAELGRRRPLETAEALRRLGVAPAAEDRLRVADGAVAAREAEVAAALAAAVRRWGGSEVVLLATWAHDGHRDHEAVGRAARAAADGTGAQLAEYLVWAWHLATPEGGEVPLGAAVRVPLGRRTRAARRWATAAYRTQVRAVGPGPGGAAVLPGPVLRRAFRPFDVVLLGAPGPGGHRG